MNIEQWIYQIDEAYRASGVTFSPDKKALLLSEISESSTESQKEIVAEAKKAIARLFFKKASRGETFGSISRIKEMFGQSLEENYGLSSGPFIDMAKTYWTYKIEVQDLSDNIILVQVLNGVEFDIASAFFPTPGLAMMPLALRKESQRHILQEWAPDIDIERFQSENPILKADEARQSKSGCLGSLLVFLIGFIIVGVFAFLLM